MDEKEELEDKKNPIWNILGIFLLLMIVAMAFPYYSIKIDPRPDNIPKIYEVVDVKLFNKSVKINNLNEYAHLVKPIDDEIKRIANKIAYSACNGEKICHAKAMYYFIRDNYEYISDPVEEEYIEYPREFLAVGGGDCESGSIALAALLESVGVDAQMVFITGHAYVRIKLDKAIARYKIDDWIYLDWTCFDCDFGEIPWKNIRKNANYVEV